MIKNSCKLECFQLNPEPYFRNPRSPSSNLLFLSLALSLSLCPQRPAPSNQEAVKHRGLSKRRLAFLKLRPFLGDVWCLTRVLHSFLKLGSLSCQALFTFRWLQHLGFRDYGRRVLRFRACKPSSYVPQFEFGWWFTPETPARHEPRTLIPTQKPEPWPYTYVETVKGVINTSYWDLDIEPREFPWKPGRQMPQTVLS